MSYDFKENLVITKQLSKLCYTAVAKMPHQYFRMGDQIRLGKLSNQRCRIIPYVYREVYNFRNEIGLFSFSFFDQF